MAYRDKAHTALLTQVAGRVLASPETAHYIPLYNVYHRIPIDTDDGIRVLFDLCRAVEAVLLVIDPLHAAHSGRSLQDGWAARRTLSRLKDLAGDKLGPHGPTVLVTHHAARRGPSRVAENAQLAACASQFLIMKSQNDASESQRQVTLVSKGRLMEVNRTFRFLSPSPLEYQAVESFSTQIAEMTHPAFALPPKPIEKAIVDALYQWPMTPNDLADELGYSPSAVGNTLTRLVRHGKIAVIGKVGRAREYDLRDEVRTAMSATEPKKEEKEDKG